MFGGAHAGDAVESRIGTEVEKTCDFDAALARQTGQTNALARDFRLLRAECESERLHAIVSRRMQHQRAPATSISSNRCPGARRNFRHI